MKRCALFGHRDCPPEILDALCAQIEKLYLENGVTEFYVGYQGQFDSIARKALRCMKCVYPELAVIVTLAYFPVPDRMPVLHETEISLFPDGLETVPPRFGIEYRNRWMVDRCDCVLCYVTRGFGGAAKAVERARRKGKTVINMGML